jgi:hypothetical protein
MRRLSRFWLVAWLVAEALLSAGCKSDCEKVFDKMISFMKEDPEGKDVFGAVAEFADLLGKATKTAFIKRCELRRTREELKCLLNAKERDVFDACTSPREDGASKATMAEGSVLEHVPSGADGANTSGPAVPAHFARDMRSDAASQNTAGMRLYKRRQYAKARARFKAAIALDPGHPIPHYNAACQSALLNDIPATLQHLRDWYSIVGGAATAAATVEKDRDFDVIRQSPGLKALMNEWR